MTPDATQSKAARYGPPAILGLVLSLFAIAFLLSRVLGLPPSINIPFPVKTVGGSIAIVGVGFALWTFRQRNPADVMTSTYVSLVKALRRVPATDMAGRTELLVVEGPQKYTRNPLYFGVILVWLGLAIFTATAALFIATLVFIVWFRLIMIPYEERELHALFGAQWEKYAAGTPMLVPLTKRKGRYTGKEINASRSDPFARKN